MSARNICDIVLFHTPLDTSEHLDPRVHLVRNMTHDYLLGMGIEWDTHDIVTDHESTLMASFAGNQLVMSFWKSAGLIPCIRVSLLPDSALPLSAVESFLSDISRIFRGQFPDRYFLEYDPIYHLDEMNKGKVYNIDSLAHTDMTKLMRSEIIEMFDALYFLHFRLVRELSRSLDSEVNINTLLNNSKIEGGMLVGLGSGLSASQLRISEVQSGLVAQIARLRSQIDIFTSLLPSLGYSIHL